MKLKTSVLSLCLLLLTSFGGGLPASAATTVPGTETHVYHASLVNGTNSMSDTKTLRFYSITAEFDYDISTIPSGTPIEISLVVEGKRKLTVGQGCCVFGKVDGVEEELGASYGGGVWFHTKSEGEKTASIRITNVYDEFLDGKYKSNIGKLTAVTKIKLGDAEPVLITKSNSSGYKIAFEFKTFGLNFTVPKNLTKLWFETLWTPKSNVSAGTTLTYSNPTISSFNSKTRKSSKVAIKDAEFSLSFAAYDEDSYYESADGNQLLVERDGLQIYANQGIDLDHRLPVNSRFTATKMKVSK